MYICKKRKKKLPFYMSVLLIIFCIVIYYLKMPFFSLINFSDRPKWSSLTVALAFPKWRRLAID